GMLRCSRAFLPLFASKSPLQGSLSFCLVSKKEIAFFLVCCVLATACQRPGFRKNGFDNETSGQESDYYNGRPEKDVPPPTVEQMGQPKKRAVVLDFWNDSPAREAEFGSSTADDLRALLYRSQRVMITPDIRSEKTTEDFVQGEQVKVAQLVREGRKLGVSVIIVGRISKIVYRQIEKEGGLLRGSEAMVAVGVEMKLFDVVTGRELLSLKRAGQARGEAKPSTAQAAREPVPESSQVPVDAAEVEVPEDRIDLGAKIALSKTALKSAVAAAVPHMVRVIDKMYWSGHIARIQGKQVIVNAGRASGLMPGDILKVLTQGEDVYDPVTGAYLGRSPGKLKGTLEIKAFMGPDAAITELHTGSNFQEGDTVQLY
ncbi:MAG: hypothetical protein AAB425_00760, partial [Bdellovibrionota bacterium]